MTQKEAAIHRSKFKSGPFKSSLHPRDYFQSNPYQSDKPLPSAHKPLPAGQKVSSVPFKPPSLGKKVLMCLLFSDSHLMYIQQSLYFCEFS